MKAMILNEYGENAEFISAELSQAAVLGMDFAGTVEAGGEDITNFSPDDEVYGCAGGLADLQGALAEYMLADARLIAHKTGL